MLALNCESEIKAIRTAQTDNPPGLFVLLDVVRIRDAERGVISGVRVGAVYGDIAAVDGQPPPDHATGYAADQQRNEDGQRGQ